MKKLLGLAMLFLTIHAFAQVNYTANDQVSPYTGIFRQGINFDYYPPYSDIDLANLATGNPELGITGIGAKTSRPALFESFLEGWGYDSRVFTFQHMKNIGMTDMTCIVGYPSEAHRDHTVYCSNGTTESALFANLYTPIWDDGENGTPYNDDNYLAAYLYKTVTLYKDNVKFWEIWNEPGFDLTWNRGWRPAGDENGNWWDEDPDPCDYVLHAPIEHFVRTLRISYEIIKAVDPEAYVVLAGVGYESFLDAVLRNTDNPADGTPTADYPLGGGAYFDVMGFHTYPDLDGSLGHFDTETNMWVRYRHSDAAVNGLAKRKASYQAILDQYGYNNISYPKKEWIITENNTPRQAFNATTMASDESQVNYIMKAVVTAMKLDIRQMHPYQLADRTTVDAADDEYDLMGMYLNFSNTAPYSSVTKTNEGIAYKTTSDALSGTVYDTLKTSELSLSDSIGGGAFWDPVNNRYVYALWAKTTLDLDETAMTSFAFPPSFEYDSLTMRLWDNSETNDDTWVSTDSIVLSGRPIYLFDGDDVDFGLLTLACPDSMEVVIPAGDTTVVVTWEPAVATTTCPTDSSVNLIQTTGFASGADFTVGPHTIGYEVTDSCGNYHLCTFQILVTPENPGEITIDCPSNLIVIAPEGEDRTIVTWEDATATTTCLSDEVFISQNGGLYSGATFVIGGHTIGYHAYDLCGNETDCTFLVTVQAAGGSCPPSILWLTKLGEQDDHGYYLSQLPMSWSEAQAFAQNSGGYLATINSQLENDYIQSQIDQATFIGLNDQDVEGDLVWENGESITYTNFDTICSFCNKNDSLNDFAEIFPWNGQWAFEGQWTQRPFLMEMNCSVTSSIELECPDDISILATAADTVVSWIEPTGITSCEISNQLDINQLGNQLSGSTFTFGTHTINYQASDSCGNISSCSFDISISVIASNCPTLPGYTKLGEYNGKAYFLSDTIATWEDAVTFSEDAGGHLVTINSEEENEFVRGTLGFELAFIGFADANEEGIGQWANGDTSLIDHSYNNTEENDYAVINFWDGSWEMYHTEVRKKYIVELACTTTPPAALCDEKDGFDFMGKFNGHGYYLSEQKNLWSIANTLAIDNGGYLTSITTQAENDFIQANIGQNQPYIGLTDHTDEDSLIWSNGDTISLDLSYDNTPDQDYAVINFWAGTWELVNGGVYKKYIMEVGCEADSFTESTNAETISLMLTQKALTAHLSWEVAQTTDISQFIILRADYEGHFTPIGQFAPKGFNAWSTHHFTDNQPTFGWNKYLVAALHSNKTTTFSNPQTAYFSERNGILVYPNPASQFVMIDLLPFKGQQVDVTILNQFGQVVKTSQIEKAGAAPVKINLSQLRNGFYEIQIAPNLGKSISQKLIIAKEY